MDIVDKKSEVLKSVYLYNSLDLLWNIEVELEHLVEHQLPLLQIQQLVTHLDGLGILNYKLKFEYHQAGNGGVNHPHGL